MILLGVAFDILSPWNCGGGFEVNSIGVPNWNGTRGGGRQWDLAFG